MEIVLWWLCLGLGIESQFHWVFCVSVYTWVLEEVVERKKGWPGGWGGVIPFSFSLAIVNGIFSCFEETYHSCCICLQIYFQSMVMDGINMADENAFVGEIEIEMLLTRMIGTRKKSLVPVFDYLQSFKFQQARFAES